MITLLCLALAYTAPNGTPTERVTCVADESVAMLADRVACTASTRDGAVGLVCEALDVPDGCDDTADGRERQNATCSAAGVTGEAYLRRVAR